MLNSVSQPWTSSSHHKLCIQVLHESWTKHYHQRSWSENALASCLKVLGVHQLNAEYIWSCKPSLHDNLGLTGVRQKIVSQHHSTRKHANFTRAPFVYHSAFFYGVFPLFLDYSFKTTCHQPTNDKLGKKHMLRTRPLRWLSRVWPPTRS